MTSFKKYCEIDNCYTKTFIEKIRYNGLDSKDIVYACYRKIDGSNVQFSLDEDDKFGIGSRNMFLQDNEDFSNVREVVRRENIEDKIRKFKDILISRKEETGSLEEFLKSHDKFSLIIYGELCGGLYRHPDVERDKNSVRIQGRIDYSPRNEWIAFDFCVISENESKLGNQDLLKKLCDEVGFLCQIEEFRGTLDECIEFPVEFNDDTGHRFWNLPLIDGNTAEGVVIKPIEAMFIGESRVILKNKTPKFKERIRETKNNKPNDNNMKPLEEKWFNVFKEYANESRAYSALSKIGIADFSALMKEVYNDAYKDFIKDNGEEFDKDTKSNDPKDFNFSIVSKAFSKLMTPYVRKVFLENR